MDWLVKLRVNYGQGQGPSKNNKLLIKLDLVK